MGARKRVDGRLPSLYAKDMAVCRAAYVSVRGGHCSRAALRDDECKCTCNPGSGKTNVNVNSIIVVH